MSKIVDKEIEVQETTTDTTTNEKEEKVVEEKKPEPKTAVVKAVEKKISVTAYLQLKPQNSSITLLLKKNYAMKFYTESQWDDIVQTINNKKTK